MGALITAVDLESKKVEDVSAAWMKANEARWKGWISK
jgi:glycine betaine/proline transport system substrate-binding protein